MSSFIFRNSTTSRSLSTRPGHGSWLEMEMLKDQCAGERQDISKLDKQMLANAERSSNAS